MKPDMKKKLLLLGGSRCLLPVIEKAHALGFTSSPATICRK
jgi:hypothetical protein